MLYIINSIHPRNHELFAFRLLLRRFPARTLDELQAVNDGMSQDFYEVARQVKFGTNQGQQAEMCLQDPIDINKPSSGIRFILAQMICHGVSRGGVGSTILGSFGG
jgi:hypothetical protein